MFLIIIANAKPTKSARTTNKKTHLHTISLSPILSLQDPANSHSKKHYHNVEHNRVTMLT